MSPEPATWTLATCAEAMARGEISSTELTRAFLDRAEALNPALNAYLLIDREGALAAARRADEERRSGRTRGPLHGVPIALKDLYDTAGVRTTAGSKHLAHRVPDADAHVVGKLREAGAVLLGKLNMHEWALGVTNNNPHWGACRNPWDTSRVPGGSSGGTGAAVAAGMTPAGLGSDTGGSIRIPASLCGITGLKPTFGRVSTRGMIPLAPTLDHAGPMAMTVEDCALLLQATAGYDPLDPQSADEPVDDYRASLGKDIRGLRVALATGALLRNCATEVETAVREAARALGEAGALVEETEVPLAEEAGGANGLIIVAEAAAYHEDRLSRERDGFGADVLARLDLGAQLPATAYARAELLRREFRRALGRDVFSRFDVLLHPTTVCTAPPIEDEEDMTFRLTQNTGLWNLAGVPVLALPCGFDSNGLPIGLSMVGRHWEEATLLRAGHAYQQMTTWHTRRPSL